MPFALFIYFSLAYKVRTCVWVCARMRVCVGVGGGGGIMKYWRRQGTSHIYRNEDGFVW